jgi:hypothetical protein
MGWVWYIHGSSRMVSPYFQATCLPLALHLFTYMDLLVTTSSWVWFGISMALAGWSAYVHLYGSTCDYILIVWFGIAMAIAGWYLLIFRLPA